MQIQPHCPIGAAESQVLDCCWLAASYTWCSAP